MNLAALADHCAHAYPERTAFLIPDGDTLTYRQVQQQCMALAGGLQALGIKAGDRVAVMLPNILPFPVVVYSLWRLGAQLVTISPLLKAQEVNYILQDCQAVALVVWGALLPGLQSIRSQLPSLVITIGGEADSTEYPYEQLFSHPPLNALYPTQPDDVVAILYTSGTTGRPKGAMLTSRNLDYDSAAAVEMVGVMDEDRLYCVLPLFHAFALNVALLVFMRAGASVFLEPRFVPVTTMRHLAQQQCTVFIGVPALFAALLSLDQNTDLSALRLCISGGAPLSLEVLKAFESKFQTVILEGDGPTECSPITTFNPIQGNRKIGSVGLPLPGLAVGIMAPDTNEFLPQGEIGEIVFKGENIFKGYLNQPEATAQVLREGWYHTGDLGYLDEDGYLFMVDRLKDLILAGGLNVYPREVEEILFQHPAVANCAVVGEFDAVRGETVHAFVQCKPGTTVTALQLIVHCRQQLADYKCPRQVTFLETLPMSPTGKILKRTLKEGLKGHPL